MGKLESSRHRAIYSQQAPQSYFTLELTRHTPLVSGKPAVVVNNVACGLRNSELLTRKPEVPFMLRFLEFLTARTIQEEGETIVDAAVLGNEAHGKYHDHQMTAT